MLQIILIRFSYTETIGLIDRLCARDGYGTHYLSTVSFLNIFTVTLAQV